MEVSTITPAQLKCLHTLFSRIGISKEVKQQIIYPAASSKELTFSEAAALIKRLKQQQANENREEQLKAEKMRRKIISMAHEMHWRIPGTTKINMQRLDGWCKTYGYKKKALDSYTYKELPTLVSQFEKVYKSFITSAKF